ncbi:MAG: hypothetical protein GYA21_09545 [Myxococcales bacterium]|nr:hypothetical protein [Myxococcales bacterium]
MRTLLRISAVVLAVWSFTGCGASDSACGPGHDDMPAVVDDDTDLATFWIGTVGVSELNIIGAGAEHTTLVQAHFEDMTDYQVYVAQRTLLSDACFLYEGRPEVLRRCRPVDPCDDTHPCPAPFVCRAGSCFAPHQSCTDDAECDPALRCDRDTGQCDAVRCNSESCGTNFACQEGSPTPLRVERVAFTGITWTGGAAELVPDPDKKYRLPPKVLPLRAYAGTEVGIQVFASGSGEQDYPAFAETLRVPEAPTLTHLDQHSGEALADGPSLGIDEHRTEALTVSWKKGNGDYVEVLLSPGSGSDTPWKKLRCITFDDGCLEIPAEGIALLARDTATNFNFKIERHSFKLVQLLDGTVLRAVGLLDLSAELQGVVGR